MALQSSGAISINNINVELGKAGTTTSSLGQSDFRTLAGVASGAISMSNFYGKSNWIYNTGLFVGMTNNTTPAGFTASADTTNKYGTWEPYYAFDNNTGTNVTWGWPTADRYVSLTWTNPIKITEIKFAITYSSTPGRTYGGKVGVRRASDNAWIQILAPSQTVDTVHTIAVPAEYQSLEINGIRGTSNARSDLIVGVKELQITKWYSK